MLAETSSPSSSTASVASVRSSSSSSSGSISRITDVVSSRGASSNVTVSAVRTQKSGQSTSQDSNVQSLLKFARLANIDVMRLFESYSSVLRHITRRQDLELKAQTLRPYQVVERRRLNEHVGFNKTLPFELVATIFLASCGPTSPTREADLRAICSVCSSWRSIALDCSVLWNDVRFDASNTKRTGLDHFRLCLERSKKAPLVVEVVAHSEPIPTIEAVATLLNPHFWRCQNLDLHFSKLETAKLFLPLPQRVPYLSHLSLTIEPSYIFTATPTTLLDHTRPNTLQIFEAGVADCAPRSVHIYAPHDIALIVPKFADLRNLENLGVAISLPSTLILDVAAQAPQLRSLDLMVHHPDPVQQPLLSMRLAYPKLERQRIAGEGCASLIPAPHLRSLTLVDEASMRAVDQLMSSRPTPASRRYTSPLAPLFPQLRTLTFVFGGASDSQSSASGRFENLARFIREHEELVSLNIVAGWAPVPYLLDASLSADATDFAVTQSERATVGASCPKLELLKIDMVLPVELDSLAVSLLSLARTRDALRIELAVKPHLEIPRALEDVCAAYPDRLVLARR